jgi:hypothetical protein
MATKINIIYNIFYFFLTSLVLFIDFTSFGKSDLKTKITLIG